MRAWPILAVACLSVPSLAACSSDDDSSAESSSGGPSPVVELLSNDGFLTYLEQDADRLYFQVNGGAIVALSKSGGAPVELAPVTGDGIALDATHVWLAGGPNGNIRRIPIAGGDAEDVVTGELSPNSIAVDDAYVYWTNFDTYQADPPDGSVVRAKKDGSAREELATTLVGANDILVDGDSIWFTTRGDGGTVRRADKNGDNLEIVASDRVAPRRLAPDAERIYWFDDLDGSNAGETNPIVSLPKSGGEPTVLFEDEERPADLTVRDGVLYWSGGSSGDCTSNPDYWNGFIRKMPVGGGAPVTVASGLLSPFYLAVDDMHVHFTRTNAHCSGLFSAAK